MLKPIWNHIASRRAVIAAASAMLAFTATNTIAQAWPAKTITVEIAPAPAMSGMPIGTTLGSALSGIAS